MENNLIQKNDNSEAICCHQKKITEVMGWVCPKCKQTNAPWKPNCDCNNTFKFTNTNITTEY